MTPTNGTRASFEAWWPLIARAAAFLAGIVILYHEVFISQTSQLPVLAVGVGLLGPVVATGVADVFGAIRGK